MMRGDYTREAVTDPLAAQREIPAPPVRDHSGSRYRLSHTRPTSTKCCLGQLPTRQNSADDLIVFLNGKVVGSVRALQAELNLLQPGQDAEFVVRRGSELVTVTLPVPVELETAPASP